jgi:hypothetical protein
VWKVDPAFLWQTKNVSLLRQGEDAGIQIKRLRGLFVSQFNFLEGTSAGNILFLVWSDGIQFPFVSAPGGSIRLSCGKQRMFACQTRAKTRGNSTLRVCPAGRNCCHNLLIYTGCNLLARFR